MPIPEEIQENLRRREEGRKFEAELRENDPHAQELWERLESSMTERLKMEDEIDKLPPLKRIPIISTLKEVAEGYRDLLVKKKEKEPSGIEGEYQKAYESEEVARIEWENYVREAKFREKKTDLPVPVSNEDKQAQEEVRQEKLKNLKDEIMGEGSKS